MKYLKELGKMQRILNEQIESVFAYKSQVSAYNSPIYMQILRYYMQKKEMYPPYRFAGEVTPKS